MNQSYEKSVLCKKSNQLLTKYKLNPFSTGGFLMFFGGYRSETLVENGLITIYLI